MKEEKKRERGDEGRDQKKSERLTKRRKRELKNKERREDEMKIMKEGVETNEDRPTKKMKG